MSEYLINREQAYAEAGNEHVAIEYKWLLLVADDASLRMQISERCAEIHKENYK